MIGRDQEDAGRQESVLDGDLDSGCVARSQGDLGGRAGCLDVLVEIVTEIQESLDRRLQDMEHQLGKDRTALRMMLTERDVAKLIQCDVRTVRRLEKGGVLPLAIRFGGSKRWRAETIEAWLDDLSEERAG